MPSGGGFAFGPFELDVRAHRLVRAGQEVRLTRLQMSLLIPLVTRAGQVLSKDHLIETAWAGVTTTDNSVEQVVSQLRKILDRGDPRRYIDTARQAGYSFVAPVTPVLARRTDADLDALIAPHRALLDGRAALETLERTRIASARATFGARLVQDNNDASFHVGFANACALEFEATRADPAPDEDALRKAAIHAREACRLAPEYAEAWATLGFVLERTGARADALGALRRSVTLEPDNWRHYLRLSSAGSGEERLRAARRMLALLPDAPLAHLLAATVYVARDARETAERELDAGLLATESSPPERFPAAGLHWLKGLLRLARGRDDEALEEFDRELALEARDLLYTRECCANTSYAIGACRLRQGEASMARVAFEAAIRRVPGHVMARAGLSVLGQTAALDEAAPNANGIDVALSRAVSLAANGDATGAARLVDAALAAAPPGNAGWLIPIEPLLHVGRDRGAWAPVLARLRTRAS
jgi:DNA-binding winged helix-turn-helix (wHTH) protein/cytochrome c-type biogenesis protein CcmH/NrfG